jgi:hypothetical protein
MALHSYTTYRLEPRRFLPRSAAWFLTRLFMRVTPYTIPTYGDLFE